MLRNSKIKNNKELVQNIKVGNIPPEKFRDYRLSQIFDGYKWDYQSGEQPTISHQVVLLDDANVEFLKETSERLYAETVAMEQELRTRPDLLKKLGLSDKLIKFLTTCDYKPEDHIRLMRFDFHPTVNGWMISEVNSDVPAGFQEASLHPKFAAPYFPNYEPLIPMSDVLIEEVDKKIQQRITQRSNERMNQFHQENNHPKVGFVYDQHTVEDAQLMQYIGDQFESRGFEQKHLDGKELQNNADLNAIVRHYPAEWLEFQEGLNLETFFKNDLIATNHPIAVITQSKALPLVWDELKSDKTLWKKLLPKTKVPSKVKRGWIFKPSFGRVGQGIDIPGAVETDELLKIRRCALGNKTQWVQQKLFKSQPIDDIHLCLGVFVVNGRFAGAFSRASKKPLMDFNAMELPVLKIKH